jgi:hypothetical protein
MRRCFLSKRSPWAVRHLSSKSAGTEKNMYYAENTEDTEKRILI